MNLQIRMSDDSTDCIYFAINELTTVSDWVENYGNFCIKFLQKLPSYQTIKRKNFIPPIAYLHTRCTINYDWVNIGYGNGLRVYYKPGYDCNKLYQWAKTAHEKTIELKEFLECSMPKFLNEKQEK